MSEQDIKDLEIKNSEYESHIGKYCLYIVPDQSVDKIFGFSSTLDGIGKQWDISVKNYSAVFILSESENVFSTYHNKELIVSKVMVVDKIVWIPTGNLIPIDKLN